MSKGALESEKSLLCQAIEQQVAQHCRARFIPTLVLIDPEGKVAGYGYGWRSKQFLLAELKRVGLRPRTSAPSR